ncbi:MAG: hypothetical protein M3Q05_09850 [Bacteroidota bacterium]|nr:hypothetical protein [Bacteroidota bacterium]
MQKYYSGLLIFLLASCTSLHEISTVPTDRYHFTARFFQTLTGTNYTGKTKKARVDLKLEEDTLKFKVIGSQAIHSGIRLKEIQNLRFHRHTFDVDVFTIPFKIRPGVKDFPMQLNPNFSGALYLGRRHDYYRIRTVTKQSERLVKITGVGYGYGGILGIGGVTMNPFVTHNKINYEYDGFVITGGLAGIYDAKKFNLGLALGTDLLLDKNRKFWLYQGKPWLGFLFGINLN